MSAVTRLFCLPYAGGRGAIFQRWQPAMPADVEVCPVELPGHGRRIAETPCSDMASVVTAVAASIVDRIREPFAVFGHSMGALIAFELARRLRRQFGVTPKALYVSARRAPHIIDPRAPWYGLPSDKFFAAWRRLNGLPQQSFVNPRVCAVVEPILRADCQIVQTYRFVDDDPLDCPIVAFGGSHDAHCSAPEIALWAAHTRAGFVSTIVDGDHFFIESSRQEFLPALSADVRERLTLVTRA
ncbi:MAG TPA: alpha/beta fold hydrolase [Vicinamibacterales bacterium]|nr:alpha/beta fold hydrolase [Vicinamibacterales bacterium]